MGKVFKNGPSKICGRPYHFKFFKGCLTRILLGPFLNTLTHMIEPFLKRISAFYRNCFR